MNKPKKINILGTDVQIRFFGENERRELDGRLGHWCSGSQTIAIAENLSSTATADSFLHEVLHAISWFLSFKKQIDNSKNTVDCEELIVSQLASSLQSVIRSNIEVFAWYCNLIKPIEMDLGIIRENCIKDLYGK